MDQYDAESNMIYVVTQIHVNLVALVVLITSVSTTYSFDGGGCFVIIEMKSLHEFGSKRNDSWARCKHTLLSHLGECLH